MRVFLRVLFIFCDRGACKKTEQWIPAVLHWFWDFINALVATWEATQMRIGIVKCTCFGHPLFTSESSEFGRQWSHIRHWFVIQRKLGMMLSRLHPYTPQTVHLDFLWQTWYRIKVYLHNWEVSPSRWFFMHLGLKEGNQWSKQMKEAIAKSDSQMITN